MKHICFTILLISVSCAASGESTATGSYSIFGTFGLIDMPSALPRPDAELASTAALTMDTRRNTLSFQVLPRLSASLRYAQLFDDGTRKPGLDDFRFDRSLSVQYLLADETELRPAIAIGLSDFLGTGIYRSEYIVTTKTLSPKLKVTGGIGWGRLAGVAGFRNPLAFINSRFAERDERRANQGGEVEVSEIFHREAAFFCGLEYQATDRLKLMLEYSSDRYKLEDGATLDYRSPINAGLSYLLRDSITLDAHYLYGSELGVKLTYALNLKNPPNFSGLDKAPPLVVPRSAIQAAALGWPAHEDPRRPLESQTRAVLAAYGLDLHGLSIAQNSARIEIENPTYPANAKAVGHAARAMTSVLPPEHVLAGRGWGRSEDKPVDRTGHRHADDRASRTMTSRS